jgi:diguanylate cyclase (GGDEF)-like protein
MDGSLGCLAMARTLAYVYIAGASLGLASLAVAHHSGATPAVLLGLCAVSYAVGFLLLFGARTLPPLAIPGLLGFGTLVITAAVYADGAAGSAYAVLYVWIGMLAFAFLDRSRGVLQILFLACAYATAVALLGFDRIGVQQWLLTMGATAVASVLVASMRDRVLRLVARLTSSTRIDPLTGLANRRAFDELLEAELARTIRQQRAMSVVVGDLDGFQAVNEEVGEKDADAMIVRLAKEMRKWKRRSDVAARTGGEEFALLLPETDERGAFLVAERIRRAVQRTTGDHPVNLTMSLGVATHPEHGDEVEPLLRAADHALAAAKELGADRTVIFSEEVSKIVAGAQETGERRELQLATVIGLAEALDIRDAGTASHAQTVARYARLTAEALGLTDERVERVRLAGLLHDVGRVTVSDDVLAKPGPLSEGEWQEVRSHPEMAARLLARPEFADLRQWIAAHHERPDGGGYPRGLSGDEIPLEARILAVADAYEAMTNDRAYRAALSAEEARSELVDGAGSQFDADVVKTFLHTVRHEPVAPPSRGDDDRARQVPRVGA